MRNKSRFPRIYLLVVLAVMYLPILLVVIYSFNESKLSSVWGGFSLTWYETLFRDTAIFEALRNSLVLALLTCLCAAVIGTLGAVGMQRLQSRTKGAVEYLSTLPIMIPEIILGMVFMVFFALLGLPFGMTTLVIAHTAFCIPYIFMLVKARLVGMDKSLAEAARDLGAGEVRVFFDITLPLIFPAILSGMLLSFAMSMDDVIISMFVTGVDVNTLPIKIYSQIKFGVTPEINALCTLMLLVTILIVVLSDRVGRTGQRKVSKNNQ
jgi:spermidine/putrescine transport system permease protein